MDSIIKRKTVSDLFGMNFFIPNYQRGYRWTEQQVEDLLKDIYDFKLHCQGEFYCLQPIIVKKIPKSDLQKFKLEGEWYEVIDGQQRLTTLKIILKYLVLDYLRGTSLADKYGKEEFKLKYETRKDSEDFFERLNLNSGVNDSNIDYYHISKAFEVVKKWFEKQEAPCSAKKEILNTFIHDKNSNETIQIIWYETQEESPTSVFKRLNSGKIPLTNAELIKALFLNSANFSNGKEKQNETNSLKSRIYLRQLEISTAWDKIEYTLHDDEFWLFLHDDSYTNPTRIDFIFDLIKANDYLKVKENCFEGNEQFYLKAIGQDTYQTFRYFERFLSTSNLQDRENKIDECWKKVKSIFDVFAEWYKDIELFHYIGYLNYFDKNISSIYKLWEKSKDINEFINEVKKLIAKKILICKKFNQEYDESAEKHPDIISKLLREEYPDKTKAFPLLFLHNIQTVINQNRDFKNKSEYSLTLYYKFPFHLFKRETWNIEHIYPNTTNNLEDKREQKEWLLSIYNSKTNDDMKEEIKEFLDKYSSTNKTKTMMTNEMKSLERFIMITIMPFQNPLKISFFPNLTAIKFGILFYLMNIRTKVTAMQFFQ